MGHTLSDFSALKGLKKEMEKQEQAASPNPAVRRELDEVVAVSCSYTFGGAEQYGTGATAVTVR